MVFAAGVGGAGDIAPRKAECGISGESDARAG
jgi:hypothetical protein